MRPVVVQAPRGANHDHLTLNIAERQVLMRMDGEQQRYWHHLLLHRVEGSQWITCDPSGEVTAEDLAGEEVIPLLRHAEFPAGGRPILALPLLDDVMLAAVRTRAQTLAEVHGLEIPRVEVNVNTMWVHADTCHPRFGTEVPSAVVADAARTLISASVGIAKIDVDDGRGAEWTHIQRLVRSDLSKWLSEKREGAGRVVGHVCTVHDPHHITTFLQLFVSCSKVS